MKILILALSGIGDALMFTPALKLMKESFPDAEIDALVMFKGVQDIYVRNTNLNKIIYFDFMKEGIVSSIRFLNTIRHNYDISINVYPSNRSEYNVINFLIGAEKRAGVKYLRRDARNLGWLNNVRIDEVDTIHNVQSNIRLVEQLFNEKFNEEPPMDLMLTENDLSFAKEYINKLNLKQDELLIGFHPGSATLKNHIHRRWEPEKFASLGKSLIDNQNAKILLFGGPEELELKKKIKDQINSDNSILVETDNLAQSAAIMKKCNLFVSNDSSLMHVASALRLKVLAIIGPTNTHYIHPWQTNYSIVTLNLDCSPCFFYSPLPLTCIRTDIKYKCIKELTCDMVYNSAIKLLNQ